MTLVPDNRALHFLLDSVSDYAIYMLDRDGRIITWNSGAQRLKGYAPSEIEGEHFERFFTLEDRRRGLPQSLMERARQEGKVESEGWRIRKDGTRF
jgi:PAS domain S-box-containing protein